MFSRIGLAALSGFVIAASADARTWYVNADGTADASTIYDGVQLAAAGDTIEVACGAYSIRNVVLRYDLVLRSEGGTADCAEITASPPGRHLQVDPGVTLVLEGFRFQGGQEFGGGSILARNSASVRIRACDFVLNRAFRGGAIYAETSVDVELESCEFRVNRAGNAYSGGGAGGAVYMGAAATLQASDCDFLENQPIQLPTGIEGGALFLLSTSEAHVTNCRFRWNAAQVGGAIAARSAQLTVEGSLFEQNSAVVGYGYAGVGGAIYQIDSQGSRISTSVFDGNRAVQSGAIHFQDGSGEIVDSTLRGNIADRAGGIRIDDSDVSIQNSFLLDNLARNVGGLHVVRSTVVITGTVIARNNSEWEKGGGILSHGSTLTLDHVTLHGNRSLGIGSGLQTGSSQVNIFNSIVTGGIGGSAVDCYPDETPPVVRCSNIFGNAGGDWVDCIASQASINRNFSADPLYCDAEAGLFALHSTSPCAPPGNEGCGQIGALGVACGPVSITSMSWGRLKSLYR